MTMRFKILYIVLLSCMTAFSQRKQSAFDKYFSALAKDQQLNGNVFIARKGKIIYEKSFGYSNFANRIVNTSNTSFPIGSITKTFTSTAILQLQQKGKLNIKEPVATYLPDFPYPSLTIEKVMSHTSGIPNDAFYNRMDSLTKIFPDTFFTNQDVIPLLTALKNSPAKIELDSKVEYPFAYSNLNYFILALIIEKRSGLSFGTYLKKNIFLPAGMLSTRLSEFYRDVEKKQATEYEYAGLLAEHPENVDTVTNYVKTIYPFYNFHGHGDIISTTHDLLKYDEALRSGILLEEPQLKLAVYPFVNDMHNFGVGVMAYGLGWMILKDKENGEVVMHHGGVLGCQSMLIRNITKHQTIVILDNTKRNTFPKAMDALKILNGETVLIPKKSGAILYGKALLKEGIKSANLILEKLQKDKQHYSLEENELNTIGYEFFSLNKKAAALEVLKKNTELYPASWNVYDSYGEALLVNNQKEKAIKMYKKSIALNPENLNGKRVLEAISK